MRVLLVSANQERSPDPVAPLGLCYVATATAAAGHDVALLDLCFRPDVETAIADQVRAARPDVIGISLRNVDNCAFPDTVSYLPHYRRVVDACRAASAAPIVLGGSAFTTMPAHYLRTLGVSYGVVGEGEVTFPALLERLARGAPPDDLGGLARQEAGRTRVNPPAWLPAIDGLRADRRWIDSRVYFERGGMANLQTKRGCHFKCTFCAYPVIEGRGMRTRDPALVAAEVRELLDVHGIDQFFVVDSIFNAPRGYAERVATALRPLGRRIRWSCFVGPGNFTPELADLMMDAGCQSVDFGTDAASAGPLRAFRKSFTVDDIRAASTVCRERGLPFCHSLVFGGEGETWDSVAETIAVMDACRPTAVNAMCGVRVYPETPLARALLARGDVASPESLHEPFFYFAPAVREGLAEVVAAAARARGNWLLPGNRVNDEEQLFLTLRGRGLKGDLWRYVVRLGLGARSPRAAGARSRPSEALTANALHSASLRGISSPMFLTPAEAATVRERFGTPCYVYDRRRLEAAAHTALAFPAPFGFTLRYAMKANPNRAVLRGFADLGLHFDASSDHEVARALHAGIPAERIQLTSQMPSRQLEKFVGLGVRYNACSLHQLDRFGQVFPGRDVSIRVNPGLGSGATNRTNTGGPGASFGIWHERLDEAKALAARHDVTVRGLHTHIGSGTDPAVWKHVTRMTLDIVRLLPDVTTVNLGGGFKVARLPDERSADLGDIGAHVRQELVEFREHNGRSLHLEIEPGTYLVANAGCVVATCIDVAETGAGGYRFAKLDTGMTEITRPSLYGAQHPITVLAERETRPTVFVGPCCESGDILTPAPGDPEALAPRVVPQPAIGDLVVVGGAGAYCAAMSTINYNSYPQAPEVMRELDGTLRLVRRRQALEQVWANEVVDA